MATPDPSSLVRPPLWIALGIAAALGVTRCQSTDGEQTPQRSSTGTASWKVPGAEDLDTPLPYRLVDHLDQAEISSPLEHTQRIENTTTFARKIIRELNFDDRAAQPKFPGRGCSLTQAPAGGVGRAVSYRGYAPHHCVIVLPATPSTHYRIARSILSEDARIDLQVIESRASIRHPQELNHPKDLARIMRGRFVSMRQLLFVHHFESPSAGQWHRSTQTLFTSPYTRSLVILLNDAEGVVRGRNRRVFFDDIKLEELMPTAEQELALLGDADRVPGKAPLAKHGQLLPVGLLSEAKPPYDHNYDYREALLAPTPTTLDFPITGLPAKARLNFSYALHKASRRGDRVTFRVSKIFNDRRSVVFEETVEIASQGPGWRWYDARVDLGEANTEPFTLRLETESPNDARGYGLWGAPMVDTPLEKPETNVIIIAVDTLRADRLSSYGYPKTTSPNIDRLAADGVRFTRAISASNWTSPSFASIFTGRSASRHQVVHRARRIPSAFHTLPEIFREAGYVTEAIMYKAYLYNMGFEQGFERWYNVPHHDIDARANLRKAMEFLDRNDDRRFFLFLHFNDPHQPFNQPKPFDTHFADRDELRRFAIDLPITITGDNHVKGCGRCDHDGLRPGFREVGRDLYDGEVAFIDDRLGVFIDALKERGLYDDTIIVFVADHGEMMWEHADTFGHGGPWLYNTLIHVPLIIKDVASRQEPRTVEDWVQAYDLMATLVELAGLKLDDAQLDAQSLVPAMRGAARRRPVFSENVKQHVTSVTHGAWKLIVNHPPGRSVRTRLYHIASDPTEQHDLSHREAQHVHELEQLLASWLVNHRRGFFVVAKPGSKADAIEIRSQSPIRRVRSWFGATGVAQETTNFRATVEPDAPLVFVELELRRSDAVNIALSATSGGDTSLDGVVAGDFATYTEGSLERILTAATPSIHVFRGAPPVLHEETDEVNAQRLEALKALGYIQ